MTFPVGAVHEYEATRAASARCESNADGKVLEYEGDAGAEHKVRTKFTDGRVYEYKGDKGSKRLVKVTWPGTKLSSLKYEGI